MLVVLVWVVATVGVTYVANAAVELVDLQVFPQGARIEVLARAQPTPTTPPPMRATTVVAPTTTVVSPTTTMVPAPATTVPPVATTTVPASTTTVVSSATTVVAPATTVVATTTTAVGVPATTTTLPVVTTTMPPAPTTTQAPPVTTTVAPVAHLVFLELDPSEHRMGTDFRERLVTGGDGPFEMSVVSGDIPPGLQIDDDGYLWGKLEVSGRFEARLEVADSVGRTGLGTVSVFVKEFRIITARGGSVTVVVVGNSVEFFSALQGADFESAQILRSGPIAVEVSFIPKASDETSWVRCEVIEDVVCTSG